MTWVYAVVALGLVGFLLEIGLDYRKQSRRLSAERKQVRRSIAAHQKAIAEVQRQSEESRLKIEELKKEKAALVHDLNWARETLRELEEKERRKHPGRIPLSGQEED